jgi:outer membrane protein TolC
MKSPLFFRMVLTISGLLVMSLPAAVRAAETMIDIGIAEAVETSLLNNLGLKLIQDDVVFAEGASLAAEGTFDAQLNAEVGATSKDQTPVTLVSASEERTGAWNAGVQKRFTTGTEMDLKWDNGNLDTDSDIYFFDPVYNTDLRLGLKQPLVKGFGRDIQMAELKSAQTRLEAASYLVDSEAADLAAEVKKAYWELVFAHQNLEVLQISLELAKKLRDDTKTKIDAGKLAQIDLFQPESEVAQREQDLIVGERGVGSAEDRLKLLMNSMDWLIPFKPTDLPGTTPVEPEITQVYQNALNNRPDLKAAELQISASGYQLDKAQNDILPALNLLGSVGIGSRAEDYSTAVDNSLRDSDTHWQVGLSFSRPLDNSLAKGRYRQALASHNKDKTSLELLKQEIRRTVRVTVRDVELALKSIEATRKTALATSKRLEAEQIKFNAGRSTTLDVLIAQQDYARALSTENRSKIVYAQSLAELDRIQGTITIDR